MGIVVDVETGPIAIVDVPLVKRMQIEVQLNEAGRPGKAIESVVYQIGAVRGQILLAKQFRRDVAVAPLALLKRVIGVQPQAAEPRQSIPVRRSRSVVNIVPAATVIGLEHES